MRSVSIDAIQIARMFAALLVVFDHALLRLMGAGLVEENHTFAFRSGGFGVLVFFLISGFVMAHSMYDKYAADGVARNFLLRRLVRITPLYWLVTLLLVVLALAANRLDSPAPALLSMFYIPYLNEAGEVQPMHGVGWTLNYEMEFYLFFALCLCFSRRVGAVLLSSILIGLVLFRDALLVPFAGSPFWTVCVTFWSDPIVLFFLGGFWLGMLRAWMDRRQQCPRARMDVLMGVLLATLVAYEVLLWQDRMPRWLEAVFALSLVAALGLTSSVAESAAARFLKLLGDASYSTYLTHGFFLAVMYKLNAGVLPPLLYLAAAFVGSNLVGLATYKLIEKPMLVRMQSWLSRPARPAPLRPQQENA
jgi:exopolysaccharide production protein ExoZ